MPPVPANPVSNFPTWTPVVGRAPSEAVISQAMALLGDRIGVLTGAITKETAVISSPSRSGGGGLFGGKGADPAGMTGLLIGKITGALGPLAVLSGMIQSHTSGFEVFLTTAKMLGVVLGGLLMPGFVVLAGATFALARMLDGVLTPELENFFGTVLVRLMDEFELLADSTDVIGKAMKSFGITTREVTGMLAAAMAPLGGVIEGLKQLGIDPLKVIKYASPIVGAAEALRGAEAGGGDFGGEAAKEKRKRELLARKVLIEPDTLGGMVGGAGMATRPQGFMADMVKGMKSAIKAMEQAILGPARFTSGEQVYKEATLAGLNQNDFEKAMLDIMLKQLDAMNKVVSKLGDGIKPAIGF